MNAPAHVWTTDNPLHAQATPRLSVLIPFLGDDPRRLLAALATEAENLRGQVELVVLDDGGRNAELSAGVAQTIEALILPARLVALQTNEGRAKGRNRLADNARGEDLLFLDSDMLPDTPDFLGRYLALIERENPAVAFGGFSMEQCPPDPRHALHRAMAGRSDCAPAAVRRLTPEKFVFTSNLLVRRDVFDAEAFDESFKGWGWEDVEWGIRVSRRWPIVHLDNTATHLGLDTPEAIAAKYEQSAANFGRVSQAHPDIVAQYPSHRAARLLKRIPLRALWRPMLKRLALSPAAPLPARAFSMRLYRAALCAEAV